MGDFKERNMAAASFDVDGICSPVCILKGSLANSFNVCLPALTVPDSHTPLCTPYSGLTARRVSFEPNIDVTLDFWLLSEAQITLKRAGFMGHIIYSISYKTFIA